MRTERLDTATRQAFQMEHLIKSNPPGGADARPHPYTSGQAGRGARGAGRARQNPGFRAEVTSYPSALANSLIAKP